MSAEVIISERTNSAFRISGYAKFQIQVSELLSLIPLQDLVFVKLQNLEVEDKLLGSQNR